MLFINMEDYAAKMALKPDAALREYVTGHAQYREDAVLAALDELRRRGQPAPEEQALRPPLEAAAQALRTQQAAAEASLPTARTGDEAAVPEADQPVLYTPGVIVLFSVLFNTIAGAVLLAINMYQVKRTKAIWGLAAFVLVYLVAESMIVNALMHNGPLNPLLLSIMNLPAILAYVLWFWPRYVGTYKFQARGWLVPLLVCLIIMVGLGLLARYLLHFIPGAEQMLKQSMPQPQ
ncbi:MAG: hypothetical protein EOO56_09200 [Hymenobacter sp.]|nr:MAG: hypothetical protein EOO56_09200 [Hymenobacter sp.]